MYEWLGVHQNLPGILPKNVRHFSHLTCYMLRIINWFRIPDCGSQDLWFQFTLTLTDTWILPGFCNKPYISPDFIYPSKLPGMQNLWQHIIWQADFFFCAKICNLWNNDLFVGCWSSVKFPAFQADKTLSFSGILWQLYRHNVWYGSYWDWSIHTHLPSAACWLRNVATLY